ncbi:hypothetical protein NKH57_32630 [Mesorhizobium sp. M1050]|uniref:hypothetical protein n=1 Tax=unclassified Mesorhizobium TaxID=325217 RepID=UPI0012EBC15F|nr:hypothetical protein [Mesorhizobium sp. LNHC252B00]
MAVVGVLARRFAINMAMRARLNSLPRVDGAQAAAPCFHICGDEISRLQTDRLRILIVCDV